MKRSLLYGIILGVFLITHDTYGMSENVLLKSIDRYNIEETQYKEIDIELSFYTGLVCENTEHGAVDAQGNNLVWGIIAIPREIDLGTNFEIDIYPNQVFKGTDRGSVKHIRIREDGVYRIDVFCPRKWGETDNEWWTRVNNYGKIKTTGRILEE